MKSKLIKNKRFRPITDFKNSLSNISLNKVREKNFSGRRLLKLNMKSSSILAVAIIMIMIVSVFVSLSTSSPNKPSFVQPVVNNSTDTPSPTGQQTAGPTQKPVNTQESGSIWNPIKIIQTIVNPTPRPVGLIESDPNVSAPVWKAVAANAWQYFQPGVGVDSNTGLPAGSLGWNFFTDWDLGVYIQAVIDSQKIGLLTKDGDWGSHARLDKVVKFLETRELNSTTKVPFWFYGSDGIGSITQFGVDVIDTGTLFVALNNLKNFDINFTSRINNIVYNGLQNNRTDYASLVPSMQSFSGSASIYGYYCVSGFACFWPEQLGTMPDKILSNMYASNVKTPENVTLPKADISCEPLLYSFFNLNTNPKIVQLMNQTYSAHEAKYNATGQYVAFSEGISPSSNFIWEWVVMSDGNTWNITSGQTYLNINPVIYSKVSLSFLSLYNTTFARDMSIYLERILPDPANGYSAGADYNANSNNANLVASVDSNTNGLILSAARYAIQNHS
jgi:hypothetical protein